LSFFSLPLLFSIFFPPLPPFLGGLTDSSYAFLRLRDHLLESDLLDHVDLHAAKPAASNQRITDIGSGRLRANRLGVYVHWVLPPFYRLGTAATTNDYLVRSLLSMKPPAGEGALRRHV